MTSTDPRTQRPVVPKTARVSAGWTLALTSLATFMVALDALVVITALPTIGRDLHAGAATLQWTINGYGLTWAAGIIAAAALGDLYGRRRIFLTGITLFTASSAVCALAPNIGSLVAARAVQGLGAAIILPLSLTILAGVFPPERRGTMIGIWGGIGGLAIAAGPLIGGALTDGLSWHWVFWINVPIGLIVGALSAAKIVESHGPSRRLDLAGIALITSSAVVLIWSLVHAGTDGWTNSQVVIGLVLGLVLLAAFAMWEQRAAEPMLPLSLFRNRAFSAANATSFLMTAALLSASVFFTQYFQLVRGESPFGAGVRLLPMMAMPLFVAPLAGIISDRVGQRILIVIGLLAESAGILWFVAAGSIDVSYPLLVVPMILTGAGLAMALATAPTAALGSVQPAEMGRASGANSTLTRFGGAFGVAISTAIFTAHGSFATPTSALHGIHPALVVTAAFAFLGALSGLAIRPAKRPVATVAPPVPVEPVPADR